MLIEDNISRFRISQTNLPVVDAQLTAQDLTKKITWTTDKSSFTVAGLESSTGDESWSYVV